MSSWTVAFRAFRRACDEVGEVDLQNRSFL